MATLFQSACNLPNILRVRHRERYTEREEVAGVRIFVARIPVDR